MAIESIFVTLHRLENNYTMLRRGASAGSVVSAEGYEVYLRPPYNLLYEDASGVYSLRRNLAVIEAGHIFISTLILFMRQNRISEFLYPRKGVSLFWRGVSSLLSSLSLTALWCLRDFPLNGIGPTTPLSAPC